MTAAPSLLSRDVARRDCLDHLALPRLGLRARLLEANWTLKTLQSIQVLDVQAGKPGPGDQKGASGHWTEYR